MINFIKKHKYIILLIILYLLFFIQMQNVFMYADDYSFTIPTRDNFISNFFDKIEVFYKFWSGRIFGHSVVISGMTLFGIQFFRILNPLFLFLFCYYLAKIININKKYDLRVIILFLSLVMIGLNLSILNECLYWADGTILYLWGYALLMYVIYNILEYYIYNKSLKKSTCIFCYLFSTMIVFTMESTAIFLILVLLSLFIYEFVNKRFNKNILFLLLYSIIMLVICYFIPGNIARINSQPEDYNSTSYLIRFFTKLPDYLYYLLTPKNYGNLLFLASSSLTVNLFRKEKKSNIQNFVSIALIVLNILFIIVMPFAKIYEPNDVNIFIYIFGFCYLFLNLFCLFLNFNRKNNIYYSFFMIAAIVANVISVILIIYISSRFFFILSIPFILISSKIYFDGDKITKEIILLAFILSCNLFVGLICLIIIILVKKFNSEICLKLLLIICAFLNVFNLIKCIYYYRENLPILLENDRILKTYSGSDDCVINLKKLKYPSYAYQMPYDFDYIVPDYYAYYDVNKCEIIWNEFK